MSDARAGPIPDALLRRTITPQIQHASGCVLPAQSHVEQTPMKDCILNSWDAVMTIAVFEEAAMRREGAGGARSGMIGPRRHGVAA